jgi:hypothetical protein
MAEMSLTEMPPTEMLKPAFELGIERMLALWNLINEIQ